MACLVEWDSGHVELGGLGSERTQKSMKTFVLVSHPGASVPWSELGPGLCQRSPSNVCMPHLPHGVGSGTYKCLRKRILGL